MKKITRLLALVVSAAVFVSGCGSLTGSESGSSSSSGTASSNTTDASNVSFEDSVVNVAIDGDPGTFGPYETNNNGRKETLYEVYEPLAMYQERGGDIKGIMAKDWSAVDGEENTYKIDLYDYITDSNGNQITADDVIYSYMEAGFDTYKRYVKYIDTIDKIDDYSLKIKLKSSDVGTLEHILCNCWVIDKDSYESSSDKMASQPVGTGPYKITSYVEGSKVVMVARDDYWQTKEPLVKYQYQNVKTINYSVIPEATQQSIALETGEADIVNNMSASAAEKFENNDSYNVTQNIDNNCRTLIMNCNDQSVCSNLLVRQAILYAIDSQGIIEGAVDGKAELEYCVGGSMYPDVETSWDDGDYYAYNPDKAKELLKEAGYPNGLTVRLLTDTKELHGKMASLMQAYLSQVGITLEIEQYEETLVKTYMHDFSSFDIYLTYMGAPDYVVISYFSQLSNTNYDDQLNYCGINDAKLQSLLTTALNKDTHNAQSMTELYNYITDNAMLYGILCPYTYTVSDKNVTSASGVNHDGWLIPGCNEYVWNK